MKKVLAKPGSPARSARPPAVDPLSPNTSSEPLVRRLLSHLVQQDLPAGAHLTEQSLADALRVSRTPVRKVLDQLVSEGLVEKRLNRGYFLLQPAYSLFVASHEFPAQEEDALFEQVATDYLGGALPETLREQDVVARYDVSARLAKQVIRALSDERVIVQERPNQWKFNPFLLTVDASLASYAYRLVIEPQILLLPTFVPRRDLIRACRDEHLRLMSLPREQRTARIAFKVDAGFHEMIAICGNNPFFYSSVVQHDRLRQLLEYRDAPNDARIHGWLREHLNIMDAIIAGQLQEASELMRLHLTRAMQHRGAAQS